MPSLMIPVNSTKDFRKYQAVSKKIFWLYGFQPKFNMHEEWRKL